MDGRRVEGGEGVWDEAGGENRGAVLTGGGTNRRSRCVVLKKRFERNCGFGTAEARIPDKGKAAVRRRRTVVWSGSSSSASLAVMRKASGPRERIEGAAERMPAPQTGRSRCVWSGPSYRSIPLYKRVWSRRCAGGKSCSDVEFDVIKAPAERDIKSSLRRVDEARTGRGRHAGAERFVAG